jgi:hypothetical protein
VEGYGGSDVVKRVKDHLSLKYGTFWKFLDSSSGILELGDECSGSTPPDPDPPFICHVSISRAYDHSI